MSNWPSTGSAVTALQADACAGLPVSCAMRAFAAAETNGVVCRSKPLIESSVPVKVLRWRRTT